MNPGAPRPSSVAARLGRGLEVVFGWAFPVCCPVCGAPADLKRRPWCDACDARVILWDRHVCPECRRFREPGSDKCPGGHAPVIPAAVTALGAYDEALGAVVRALKYGGLRAVAAPVGRLLAGRIPRDRSLEAVVSVPTAAHKRRRRGFGHAELIASEVARALGVPSLDNALRLTRRIKDQTRLSQTQRRTNVRDAFALREGSGLAGHHVLLVDDVMTTGATMQEAARVLTSGGVASVYGAVVALNVGAMDASPT